MDTDGHLYGKQQETETRLIQTINRESYTLLFMTFSDFQGDFSYCNLEPIQYLENCRIANCVNKFLT